MKTLTENYLNANCKVKINTIGYPYNPNDIDSYGTIGGATYYEMFNKEIYRITPKEYEEYYDEVGSSTHLGLKSWKLRGRLIWSGDMLMCMDLGNGLIKNN